MQKGFLATSSLKTARDGFIYEILNYFASFPQSRAGLAEFSSPRKLSADLPSLFSLLPLLNYFLVLSFSPPKLTHPTVGPFLSLVHHIIKTKPTQCMKAFLKSASGRPREPGYCRYRQPASGSAEGQLPWVPVAARLPHPQLLRSRPSASLTAEGRFEYVFPSSFPRDFLGERKRSLKEIV